MCNTVAHFGLLLHITLWLCNQTEHYAHVLLHIKLTVLLPLPFFITAYYVQWLRTIRSKLHIMCISLHIMCCLLRIMCSQLVPHTQAAPQYVPQYRADRFSPPSSPSNAPSDSDSDEREREPAQTDWQDLCDGAFEDPNAFIRPPDPAMGEPPTLAEVMLTVLDWYASHKQTYRATSDVYRLLALVVPAGTTTGTFKQMRTILERHRLETCTEYDACWKGCIVYKDFSETGPFASHEYASLTTCPKCNEPRYAGIGDHRRASHTVHFFSIAPYLKDMFQRTDMETSLDNRPTDQTPSSSIKRSRGYRGKMLRDPNISTDHRNQGLIISSDGVPYFQAGAKHSRGAWPVVARLASLPDGLWDRFEFAHLYALEATEHWITDVETGKIQRKRR
jgi:hypothetical protein